MREFAKGLKRQVRRLLTAMRTGHLYRAKRRARSWLAMRSRRRSRAVFVAVTGSSGKSSTAALLAHILEGHGAVRKQLISNDFRKIQKTIRTASPNLDYFVIEAGVAAKGDMKPIARIVEPDIAIVTKIGLEHRSAFRSKAAIAEEKGALVEAVRPGGFALLNADDELVMGMASKTRARVVTFGRERAADYRVSDAQAGLPGRLKLTIEWKGGRLPLQTRFAGEQFWLATAAAAAAAFELGVPHETIAERIASFEPVVSRCQIYDARGGPRFIIDSVKAPYESLDSTFQMVGQATAVRKSIVLGHLSDYNAKSSKAYRSAYQAARAVSDRVIFVGENAHRSKAETQDRQSGRFREFRSVQEVYEHIRSTSVSGELVLLKGSINLHLERVALAWNEDVRCWTDECGLKKDCVTCGLFDRPFAEHRGGKGRRRRGRALHRPAASK